MAGKRVILFLALLLFCSTASAQHWSPRPYYPTYCPPVYSGGYYSWNYYNTRIVFPLPSPPVYRYYR